MQVTVMAEGAVTYCGPPERAAAWFQLGLGYAYDAARDGALSDWLMDLVSVRFAKPADLAARCAPALRRTKYHYPFACGMVLSNVAATRKCRRT